MPNLKGVAGDEVEAQRSSELIGLGWHFPGGGGEGGALLARSDVEDEGAEVVAIELEGGRVLDRQLHSAHTRHR